LRLGIAPPNYAAWYGPDEAVQIAAQAERWGFDSMWFGDHIAIAREEVNVYGNAYLDCFTAMAYVASSTKLRLGTHVAVVPYRHPLV
jgi:alkanesulfonate monooxygenase SsuD/methylene tetrahydromethanopterin reductase-like flavin-dependent oxidoreductase (luciferase family)